MSLRELSAVAPTAEWDIGSESESSQNGSTTDLVEERPSYASSRRLIGQSPMKGSRASLETRAKGAKSQPLAKSLREERKGMPRKRSFHRGVQRRNTAVSFSSSVEDAMPRMRARSASSQFSLRLRALSHDLSEYDEDEDSEISDLEEHEMVVADAEGKVAVISRHYSRPHMEDLPSIVTRKRHNSVATTGSGRAATFFSPWRERSPTLDGVDPALPSEGGEMPKLEEDDDEERKKGHHGDSGNRLRKAARRVTMASRFRRRDSSHSPPTVPDKLVSEAMAAMRSTAYAKGPYSLTSPSRAMVRVPVEVSSSSAERPVLTLPSGQEREDIWRDLVRTSLEELPKHQNIALGGFPPKDQNIVFGGFPAKDQKQFPPKRRAMSSSTRITDDVSDRGTIASRVRLSSDASGSVTSSPLRRQRSRVLDTALATLDSPIRAVGRGDELQGVFRAQKRSIGVEDDVVEPAHSRRRGADMVIPSPFVHPQENEALAVAAEKIAKRLRARERWRKIRRAVEHSTESTLHQPTDTSSMANAARALLSSTRMKQLQKRGQYDLASGKEQAAETFDPDLSDGHPAVLAQAYVLWRLGLSPADYDIQWAAAAAAAGGHVDAITEYRNVLPPAVERAKRMKEEAKANEGTPRKVEADGDEDAVFAREVVRLRRLLQNLPPPASGANAHSPDNIRGADKLRDADETDARQKHHPGVALVRWATGKSGDEDDEETFESDRRRKERLVQATSERNASHQEEEDIGPVENVVAEMIASHLSQGTPVLSAAEVRVRVGTTEPSGPRRLDRLPPGIRLSSIAARPDAAARRLRRAFLRVRRAAKRKETGDEPHLQLVAPRRAIAYATHLVHVLGAEAALGVVRVADDAAREQHEQHLSVWATEGAEESLRKTRSYFGTQSRVDFFRIYNSLWRRPQVRPEDLGADHATTKPSEDNIATESQLLRSLRRRPRRASLGGVSLSSSSSDSPESEPEPVLPKSAEEEEGTLRGLRRARPLQLSATPVILPAGRDGKRRNLSAPPKSLQQTTTADALASVAEQSTPKNTASSTPPKKTPGSSIREAAILRVLEGRDVSESERQALLPALKVEGRSSGDLREGSPESVQKEIAYARQALQQRRLAKRAVATALDLVLPGSGESFEETASKLGGIRFDATVGRHVASETLPHDLPGESSPLHAYALACDQSGLAPEPIPLRRHEGDMLNLDDYRLGDARAKALAEALPYLPRLRVLQLRSNRLSPVSLPAVMNALARGPGVEGLALGRNDVVLPLGRRALAFHGASGGLVHGASSLKEVDPRAGVAAMGAFLKSPAASVLRWLDLRRTGLDDLAVQQLCAAMVGAPVVTRLDLSENPLMGQGAAQAVAGLLVKHRAIRRLHLAWTGLGDGGVAALAEGIPAATCPLRRLDLEAVGAGDSGIAALAAALAGLPGLRSLSLRGNLVSPAGAVVLATALSVHGSLDDVDLAGCPLGEDGARALLPTMTIPVDLAAGAAARRRAARRTRNAALRAIATDPHDAWIGSSSSSSEEDDTQPVGNQGAFRTVDLTGCSMDHTVPVSAKLNYSHPNADLELRLEDPYDRSVLMRLLAAARDNDDIHFSQVYFEAPVGGLRRRHLEPGWASTTTLGDGAGGGHHALDSVEHAEEELKRAAERLQAAATERRRRGSVHLSTDESQKLQNVFGDIVLPSGRSRLRLRRVRARPVKGRMRWKALKTNLLDVAHTVLEDEAAAEGSPSASPGGSGVTRPSSAGMRRAVWGSPGVRASPAAHTAISKEMGPVVDAFLVVDAEGAMEIRKRHARGRRHSVVALAQATETARKEIAAAGGTRMGLLRRLEEADRAAQLRAQQRAAAGQRKPVSISQDLLPGGKYNDDDEVLEGTRSLEGKLEVPYAGTITLCVRSSVASAEVRRQREEESAKARAKSRLDRVRRELVARGALPQADGKTNRLKMLARGMQGKSMRTAGDVAQFMSANVDAAEASTARSVAALEHILTEDRGSLEERVRLFSLAAEDLFLTPDEALRLLRTPSVQSAGSEARVDVVARVLPRLADPSRVNEVLSGALGPTERRRAQAKIGLMRWKLMLGLTCGHWQFDLARQADRDMLARVASFNADDKEWLASRYPGLDTSQWGDRERLRNATLDGVPFQPRAAWLAAPPGRGIVKFDFVPAQRPPPRARPLHSLRFAQVLRDVHIFDIRDAVTAAERSVFEADIDKMVLSAIEEELRLRSEAVWGVTDESAASPKAKGGASSSSNSRGENDSNPPKGSTDRSTPHTARVYFSDGCPERHEDDYLLDLWCRHPTWLEAKRKTALSLSRALGSHAVPMEDDEERQVWVRELDEDLDEDGDEERAMGTSLRKKLNVEGALLALRQMLPPGFHIDFAALFIPLKVHFGDCILASSTVSSAPWPPKPHRSTKGTTPPEFIERMDGSLSVVGSVKQPGQKGVRFAGLSSQSQRALAITPASQLLPTHGGLIIAAIQRGLDRRVDLASPALRPLRMDATMSGFLSRMATNHANWGQRRQDPVAVRSQAVLAGRPFEEDEQSKDSRGSLSRSGSRGRRRKTMAPTTTASSSTVMRRGSVGKVHALARAKHALAGIGSMQSSTKVAPLVEALALRSSIVRSVMPASLIAHDVLQRRERRRLHGSRETAGDNVAPPLQALWHECNVTYALDFCWVDESEEDPPDRTLFLCKSLRGAGAFIGGVTPFLLVEDALAKVVLFRVAAAAAMVDAAARGQVSGTVDDLLDSGPVLAPHSVAVERIQESDKRDWRASERDEASTLEATRSLAVRTAMTRDARRRASQPDVNESTAALALESMANRLQQAVGGGVSDRAGLDSHLVSRVGLPSLALQGPEPAIPRFRGPPLQLSALTASPNELPLPPYDSPIFLSGRSMRGAGYPFVREDGSDDEADSTGPTPSNNTAAPSSPKASTASTSESMPFRFAAFPEIYRPAALDASEALSRLPELDRLQVRVGLFIADILAALATSNISSRQLSDIIRLVPLVFTGLRIELAVSLFPRVVDLPEYSRVLHALTGSERRITVHRLGLLNLWDPRRADGDYDLDLSVWEDRIVASALAQLSVVEPGSSLAGIGGRGGADFNNITGWKLPKTWFEDTPREGRLRVYFSSINAKINVNERNNIARRVLTFC